MAKRITNLSNIGLSMAVWLASDSYNNKSNMPDWVTPEDEIISVTTLMQPTRKFILSHKIPLNLQITPDVTDLIASTLGTAIHDSIESAWITNYKKAMASLGYPDSIIQRIRINPTTVEPGTLPVYLENRYFKRIDGVVVSGQFDQIIDGEIHDTKSTSVMTAIMNTKEDDYRFQLSCYRWLNPDKVTKDVGYIQHIFTDWSSREYRSNPNTYPSSKIQQTKITLLSIPDTELLIKKKLQEIRANVDLPQSKMIRCSEKDLWRGPPQYRYYSDPNKASITNKSTKNFDNMQDALVMRANKGKGVILTAPGRVRACSYCPAFGICTQKDEYQHD